MQLLRRFPVPMLLHRLAFALAAAATASGALALPAGFSVQRVFSSSDLINPNPVDPTAFPGHPNTLETLPDGRVFIGMMDNRGFLWDPEVDVLGNGRGILPAPFIDYRGVIDGEMGISGCVAAPDYGETGHFYVSYTLDILPYDEATGQPADRRIRIERFTADPQDKNAIVAGSGVVIFDIPDDNLASVIHFSGGLEFGGDGKLYMSLGEDGIGSNSQSPSSFRGKVLRMNPDGTPPSDNPLYIDDTRRPENYIYAMGLRNPYRLNYDPNRGIMFVTDTGGGRWEEVNILVRKGNYGWPAIEGPLSDNPSRTPPANYQDPFYAYAHGPEPLRGNAVVSAMIYDGQMFPPAYHGDLLVSDWGYLPVQPGSGGEYFHLDLDEEGNLREASSLYIYPNNQPGGGDMAVLPDGSVLIAMTAYVFGQIDRITFDDPNDPPVATITTDVTEGPAPLTVQFTASVVDERTPEILWDFGDGTFSREENPTHTYTQPGRYQATFTATDDFNATDVENVSIGAYVEVEEVCVDGTLLDANAVPAVPAEGTVRIVEADGLTPLQTAAGPLEPISVPADGGYDACLQDVRLYGDYFLLQAERPGAVTNAAAVPAGAASFSAQHLLAGNAITGRALVGGGEDPIAGLELSLEVESNRDEWLALAVPAPAEGQPGNAVLTGEIGEFYVPLPPLAPGARMRLVPSDVPDLSGPPAIVEAVQPGKNTAELQLFVAENAAGCADLPEPLPSGITFADVQNIFVTNCIGCHGSAQPYQRLMIDEGFGFSSIVNRPSRELPARMLVADEGGAGAVEGSFLLEKMNCTVPSFGAPMPLTSLISEADRAKIAGWIADGAPHDKVAVTIFAGEQAITSPGQVQFYAGAEGPGAPFTFHWDFGDGTTAITPDLLKPFFLAEGQTTRTITLRARDAEGALLGTQTVALQIAAPGQNPDNQSPVAVLEGPAGVTAGDVVLLSAAASQDPDGSIVLYAWDLDGDGAFDRTTTAPTVATRYLIPGEYAASVTAVDGENSIGTASVLVDVQQAPNGAGWVVY